MIQLHHINDKCNKRFFITFCCIFYFKHIFFILLYHGASLSIILLYWLTNQVPQRVPILKRIYKFISKYILIQNLQFFCYIPFYQYIKLFKEICKPGNHIPIPNFIFVYSSNFFLILYHFQQLLSWLVHHLVHHLI